MALDLDGFDVWRAISGNQKTFAALKAEATKSARSCLVKFIKSKSFNLAALRDVSVALGQQNFGLILDGMKSSEVGSLVTKVDKHNKEIKASSPQILRQHIVDLASKTLEPTAAPERRARGGASKRIGPAQRGYVSAGVTRKK